MKNVVVLIGGKGTSGKSTFISYVQGILGAVKCQEFSTIDPVKEIVRRMYEQEQRAIFKAMGLDYPMAYLSTKRPAPLLKEIEEKTDIYRSLLHDIKMVWCEVDDGPNMITFCLVQHFFTKAGTLAFVNCREPEQFDHIKVALAKDKPEWNVITLNMYRPGHGEDITNKGDKTTDAYEYDYTISNDGTLQQLNDQAHEFVELLQSKFK